MIKQIYFNEIFIRFCKLFIENRDSIFDKLISGMKIKSYGVSN